MTTGLEISPTLSQSLEQRQVLTQEQLQTVKLLQLTSTELRQELAQKMLDNPVLVLSSDVEIPIGDLTDDAPVQNDNDYEGNSDNWDQDREKKRDYFFSLLTAPISLTEYLQNQLDGMQGMKDQDGNGTDLYNACFQVLGNLDSNGYLDATDEEIAKGAGTDLETAAKAVKVVQSLNPPGIGGRNLREVLLLQLERNREKGSIAWDIVDKCLELLGKNHIPQIAKQLDVDVSEAQEAADRIRRLVPKPGQSVAGVAARVVMPDVTVIPPQEKGGGWSIELGELGFPEVSIDEKYLEMRDQDNISKPAKKYIREKINEGEQLIESLKYRKTLIEKIATLIVHFQKDFFAKGPSAHKPLLMSTIADRLGIAESTVSRAVANKYMKTTFGLYPFRYFFTQAVNSSSDGNDSSALAIRAKIAEIIGREDERRPLSDDKIAEILAKDGLKVARRTVAKYREAEGIPATSLRRKHI